MGKRATGDDSNPSQLITNMIAGLGDWRGEVLARLRRLGGGVATI